MQVFVVWVNRGLGDNRDAVDTTLLEDQRVRQYWDGEGIVGRSFAETDLGELGTTDFVYDVYYVFGPDATWGDEPAPVAAAGARVVDDVERLRDAIHAQL